MYTGIMKQTTVLSTPLLPHHPQLSVEMTVHYTTGRIQIVVGFVMGSPAALTIRRRKENKATYCHVSTLSRAVTNFHSLRYNICKTT